MYETININEAASMLARGKKGTFGIFKRENGEIDFYGLGYKGQVTLLTMDINGKHYNFDTFDQYMIAKKNGKNASAWFVFSTADWTQVCSSGDMSPELNCILFIVPSDVQQNVVVYGEENAPIAIKIKFNALGRSIAIVRDMEVARLWEIEAKEMEAAHQPEGTVFVNVEGCRTKYSQGVMMGEQ